MERVIRMRTITIKLSLLLLALLLFSEKQVNAQPTQEQKQVALARQYMEERSYDKAIPIFKMIYDNAPFDKDAYQDYLKALLLGAKYDDAEALVQYMAKIRRQDPAVIIDLGNVYTAAGKKKLAKEQYDLAVEKVSGDDYTTTKIADAFTQSGNTEYAIRTYEAARVLMHDAFAYGTQLALLYGKQGNTEQAADAMLDVIATQPNELNNIKVSLLQLINSEDRKLNMVQAKISKRIETDNMNPYWNDLLIWLSVQKGDFDGAYKQVIAIDKKLSENGERVISFAESIAAQGKYALAEKCYQYVLDKGKEQPMYEMAWLGKINIKQAVLADKRPVDSILVNDLIKEYQLFLDAYPQYYSTIVIRNYARLQARYHYDVDTAIAILEKVIQSNNLRSDFVGYCKLDLGDYYLLENKVWDATLWYSQVDKAFKEDQLGEDARFRNAKLAFYRGDFKWAQTQLSVLKASTSELIANDALYLSVLITENTPADSNMVPLERFAVADLLLFQNKTQESDRLLDSVAKAFPDAALQDDILMKRSSIALEEGRVMDAVSYLNTIVDTFGQDVLADDAVFQLATIYADRLKDTAKAVTFYEKLITDFPGSTYVQAARAKYQALKNKKNDF